MMQFLIIPRSGAPFNTKWFIPENHYSAGMVVFDLVTAKYTKDGKTWENIELDHL